VKETLGDVNVPLVCAGQLITPGDVVVADDDGVVVVPRADADTVLAAGPGQAQREEASRQRYAAGELSLDVSHTRERLAPGGPRVPKRRPGRCLPPPAGRPRSATKSSRNRSIPVAEILQMV
jgi:4-hydroxy-4-methyl-2-oxoglutarate aldolase